eukprot:13365837-Alexandrium_andersonii.AAC.1
MGTACASVQSPCLQLGLASPAPIAKDCAHCGLADCGLELATTRLRGFGPPSSLAFAGRIRNLHEKRRRTHPSGASRTDFE